MLKYEENTTADPLLICGRYRVQRQLGRGGLGDVFVARDEQDGGFVVIKRLRWVSERLGAVFEREARLLSQIRAPNVVRYVDLVVENGSTYLIQEYIDDAVPLDRWQRIRAMPELLRVYATIADALDVLHTAGIVHRDLKPTNVLVRRDEPVLIDFGFAIQTEETDELTGADTIVGTPAYLSPESIRGEPLVTPAVDLFALGVMLFEALTGSFPEGAPAPVGPFLQARVDGMRDPAGFTRLTSIGDVLPLLREMLADDAAGRPRARSVAERLRAAAENPSLREMTAPIAGTELRRPAMAAMPMGMGVPSPSPAAPPRHVAPGHATLAKLAARTPAARGWPVIPLVAVLLVGVIVLVGATKACNLESHEDTPALPIVGWGLLFLAAAVSGTVASRRRRLTPSPIVVSASTESNRRIAAIEAHLQRTQDFTQSLVLHLEGLLEDRVQDAVRASLLTALRDLKPPAHQPPSDTQRLLDLVEKLATPKSSRKPLAERITGYVAIPASIIAALVAAVGLLVSMGVWRPTHPPEIASFVANRPRVRPAGIATFTVDAKDADGDRLQFTYTTTAGTIEGNGPYARLIAPEHPTHPIVTVTVHVTDGKNRAVEKNQSVIIKVAPRAQLVAPAEVLAGSTVELRADVTDEDLPSLKYEWRASAGTLGQGGTPVFWTAPTTPPPEMVRILCVVSDDLGSVSLSAGVQVKRRPP